MPVPLAVVVALLAVVQLWMFWRPSGRLRQEWEEGGGVRRAATLVLTGAGIGSQAALVLGRPIGTMAFWVLGGAAGMVLLPAPAPTPAPAPDHGDVRTPP